MLSVSRLPVSQWLFKWPNVSSVATDIITGHTHHHLPLHLLKFGYRNSRERNKDKKKRTHRRTVVFLRLYAGLHGNYYHAVEELMNTTDEYTYFTSISVSLNRIFFHHRFLHR